MTAVRRGTNPHFQTWHAGFLGSMASLVLLIVGVHPLLPQQSDDVEFDAIAELLMADAGATVADVGAGSGFWAVKFAGRVGPQGIVYATEVKPELARQIQLAITREGLENVRVVVAQHSDPRLPDRCCDAVLMRFVYHALRDPRGTLEGLRRALKPGGRVLVIDFRPSARELTERMHEFGFKLAKLTDPWLGREETYGALFVRRGNL
jgi:ubiquinone/menaquinone biosynthesis C-methylase UbiE